MDKAKDILNKCHPGTELKQPQQQEGSESGQKKQYKDLLSMDDMDLLWYMMVRIYGGKWTNAQGSQDDDQIWLTDLCMLTPEMIKHGIEEVKLRHKTYIPTLMEFKDACLGIPSMNEVAAMVSNGDYSHPMANAIKKRVGSWDMARMSQQDLERRTRALYQREVDDYSHHVVNKAQAAYLEDSSNARIGKD